jgi:hypothetical protein
MFKYVPFEQLGGESNVIVGGHATVGTTQLITHWASNDTATTNHDTATGIVLNLLRSDSLPSHCQAVSSDCFSTDTLLGIFALTQPQLALEMEESLIAIARAANYQSADDRDAAHVSFVLKARTEPLDSPLNEGVFCQSPTAIANILLEELLPRLVKIIERIDYFEPYWRKGEEHLILTETLLDTGAIQVTNVEDVDLAQLNIAEIECQENGRLFRKSAGLGQLLHQMGIHKTTPHWRVLLQTGQGMHFYYRNESLAACHQARSGRQKDLSALAKNLNSREHEPGKWQVISPGSGNYAADPVPQALNLSTGAKSSLDPEDFSQIVKNFLIA